MTRDDDLSPGGGRWQTGEMLLGRYKILDFKQGGFGFVYVVEDQEDLRLLAAKTFKDQFWWHHKVVDLFNREANTWIDLGRLGQHENIVRAEFVQPVRGKPCIFLEYVEGTTLDFWIREQQLDLLQSLDFATQFCTGMTYAGQQLPGIVHRDIKPTNTLITLEGVLKITDWGLAKTLAEVSGSRVGTPRYMSPEQFNNPSQVNVQSDIYSFGVMFHEMLTGSIPPGQRDLFAEWSGIGVCRPETTRQPGRPGVEIPDDVYALTMSCLEKGPGYRPGSFAELLDEFRRAYQKHSGGQYSRPSKKTEWGSPHWTNYGASLAELRRFGEALEAYDKALEIDPLSSKTWNNKGIVMERLDRNEEAWRCYDRAVAINPNLEIAWNNRGNALDSLRLFEESRKSYDRALALNPNYDIAWNNKGWLLMNGFRDYAGALRCFGQALQLNPYYHDAWNNKGLAQQHLKLYEESLESYDRALDINPRFSPAWSNKGGSLHRLGRYEEAHRCCEKALEVDEKNARAWNNHGLALDGLGRYEEALASFDQALTLDPSLAMPFGNKGESLWKLGRPAEAVECYRRAITLDPNEASYHASLGYASYELGDLPQTLQSIGRAIELDPEEPVPHYNMGLALSSLGDTEGAITEHRKAIELDPKFSAAYNNLGACLHRAGRYAEAVAAYRQCLSIDSKHATAYNNLAMALVALEQWEEAEENYRVAVGLQPDYGEAYYNLGVLLMKRERNESAKECLLKAVEYNPGHYRALLNLSSISYQQGKLEETAEYCKRALAVKPDYRQAQVNLEIALAKLEEQGTRLVNEPSWQVPFSSQEPLHGLSLGGAGRLLGVLVRDRCQLYEVSVEQGQFKLLGELEFPWERERLFFQKIFFSQDGKHFVVAGGKEIRLFTVPTRTLAEATFGYPVSGIWLSPNNQYLVVRQSDSLTLWLVGEDAFVRVGAMRSVFSANPYPASFAFSPDGELMAIPNARGVPGFDLIGLSTGGPVQTLSCPGVLSIEPRFSRDGKSLSALVVVDEPFTLVRWDVKTGDVMSSTPLQGPGEQLHSTVLSPFGTYYAGISDSDRTIEIVTTDSNQKAWLGRDLGHHLSFSPDEKHLIAVDDHNMISVWQLE